MYTVVRIDPLCVCPKLLRFLFVVLLLLTSTFVHIHRQPHNIKR